jgi:hypothetical protein
MTRRDRIPFLWALLRSWLRTRELRTFAKLEVELQVCAKYLRLGTPGPLPRAVFDAGPPPLPRILWRLYLAVGVEMTRTMRARAEKKKSGIDLKGYALLQRLGRAARKLRGRLAGRPSVRVLEGQRELPFTGAAAG